MIESRDPVDNNNAQRDRRSRAVWVPRQQRRADNHYSSIDDEASGASSQSSSVRKSIRKLQQDPRFSVHDISQGSIEELGVAVNNSSNTMMSNRRNSFGRGDGGGGGSGGGGGGGKSRATFAAVISNGHEQRHGHRHHSRDAPNEDTTAADGVRSSALPEDYTLVSSPPAAKLPDHRRERGMSALRILAADPAAAAAAASGGKRNSVHMLETSSGPTLSNRCPSPSLHRDRQETTPADSMRRHGWSYLGGSVESSLPAPATDGSNVLNDESPSEHLHRETRQALRMARKHRARLRARTSFTNITTATLDTSAGSSATDEHPPSVPPPLGSPLLDAEAAARAVTVVTPEIWSGTATSPTHSEGRVSSTSTSSRSSSWSSTRSSTGSMGASAALRATARAVTSSRTLIFSPSAEVRGISGTFLKRDRKSLSLRLDRRRNKSGGSEQEQSSASHGGRSIAMDNEGDELGGIRPQKGRGWFNRSKSNVSNKQESSPRKNKGATAGTAGTTGVPPRPLPSSPSPPLRPPMTAAAPIDGVTSRGSSNDGNRSSWSSPPDALGVRKENAQLRADNAALRADRDDFEKRQRVGESARAENVVLRSENRQMRAEGRLLEEAVRLSQVPCVCNSSKNIPRP